MIKKQGCIKFNISTLTGEIKLYMKKILLLFLRTEEVYFISEYNKKGEHTRTSYITLEQARTP